MPALEIWITSIAANSLKPPSHLNHQAAAADREVIEPRAAGRQSDRGI